MIKKLTPSPQKKPQHKTTELGKINLPKYVYQNP